MDLEFYFYFESKLFIRYYKKSLEECENNLFTTIMTSKMFDMVQGKGIFNIQTILCTIFKFYICYWVTFVLIYIGR